MTYKRKSQKMNSKKSRTLDDIGKFGYNLYHHPAGLGMVNYCSDFQRSDRNILGYNEKNKRAASVVSLNSYLNREFFKKFCKEIPKEKKIRNAVICDNKLQLVQITTNPIEWIDVYRETSLKESFLKLFGKQPDKSVMLSDILIDYKQDGKAYVIQWSVPYFQGWGVDSRVGHVFTLSAIIGESDLPEVEKAIKEDPYILRKTGEKLFPEHFKALKKGMPYKKLPHYKLERLPLCKENLRKMD
jgi:hypothetical protein